MNTTDFGPTKPTIQPYQNGYSVPVAVKQVDRPSIREGEVEKGWQGYLLLLPFLSELEFDEAVKQLPAGDYSAERLAVLQERVRLERKVLYPPIEDYIDGMVKGDDAQVAEYKAKCLAVKKQHPMP